MVVPDRQLIIENMLMAEGFVDAKMLATKFASLYALLEDLLPPAKHYDWGLRAIKSVLVVAGKHYCIHNKHLLPPPNHNPVLKSPSV